MIKIKPSPSSRTDLYAIGANIIQVKINRVRLIWGEQKIERRFEMQTVLKLIQLFTLLPEYFIKVNLNII